MTTPELDDLIGRLEVCTGPDREIDAELMRLEHDWEERHIGATDENDTPVKDWVWVNRATGEWRSTAPLHFTESIDAALALVERKLPGYRWGVSSAPMRTGFYPDGKPSYGEGFKAHLTEPSALRPMPTIASGATAPLAILLTLLRALKAQTPESSS